MHLGVEKSSVNKHNSRKLDQVRSPETQKAPQRLRLSVDASENNEGYPSASQVNESDPFTSELMYDTPTKSEPNQVNESESFTSELTYDTPTELAPKSLAEQVVEEEWLSCEEHTSDSEDEPFFPELMNDRTVRLSMKDSAWIRAQNKIQKIIDYQFYCTGLLREAMYPIHTGKACIVKGTTNREFAQGNRKMAMLGDTIMRTVLIDVWLRREESVGTLGVLCGIPLEYLMLTGT